MSEVLTPEPLTASAFAPFGRVIEAAASTAAAMNSDHFERYHALAEVDVDPALRTVISIAQCRVPSVLPYEITLLERHPRASQAFVPLGDTQLVIVVAPPGKSVDAGDLRAFVSHGGQGIQYHRGVWHMPLIAFEAGEQFLIVDADDDGGNCEELTLSPPVRLHRSAE